MLFTKKGVLVPDRFNGVTINLSADNIRFVRLPPVLFAQELGQLLSQLRREKRKGVWLNIPSSMAKFVPIAVELGFQYHHCKPTYVTLTLWLPDSHSGLPLQPHHQIGVGGFVLNDKNEVLVIQEKQGITAGLKDFWKLPGGLVDPDEGIASAVCREVLEETGLRVKFRALACIRESHQRMFGGMTDLYCVCVCKLDNECYNGSQNPVPVPQETEISACQWMHIDDFFKIKYYSRRSIFSDLLRHAYQTAANTTKYPPSIDQTHTHGLLYVQGPTPRVIGSPREGIFVSSKL